MSNDLRVERYCRLLNRGDLTRRDFIKGVGALGVGTAMAISLVSRGALAATPKQGGRMRLAMGHGSTGDVLNPATIANGYEWTAMFGIANTLTELAPDGPCRFNKGVVLRSPQVPLVAREVQLRTDLAA